MINYPCGFASLPGNDHCWLENRCRVCGVTRTQEEVEVMPMEERACLSKKPYSTKKLALTVKNRLEKTREGRGNLRIYDCPYCDGWHITSKL